MVMIDDFRRACSLRARMEEMSAENDLSAWRAMGLELNGLILRFSDLELALWRLHRRDNNQTVGREESLASLARALHGATISRALPTGVSDFLIKAFWLAIGAPEVIDA